MIEAYTTHLGHLTLALNASRFLLEDPASNSILSLHPAIRFPESPKPAVFGEIVGFSTGPDRMEVSWGGVPGFQARTALFLETPDRLRIEFQVVNTGDAATRLDGIHPLCVVSEGPGACALGMHPLRTLLMHKPGAAPFPARVHGENLRSVWFGAWFADAGSPMLFLGAMEKSDPPLAFTVKGARGKILELRVDAACRGGVLEPGASWAAPVLRLEIGRGNIRDALDAWADAWGDPALTALLAGLDPCGPLEEREPEPEALDAPAAEPEAMTEPAVLGKAPETQPQDGTETEADSEPAADFSLEVHTIEGKGLGRGACASFRRALRANQGIWPRWAGGRRHTPVFGTSARSRACWKREP